MKNTTGLYKHQRDNRGGSRRKLPSGPALQKLIIDNLGTRVEARTWRQELIRISKCERPEITPEQARLAMLHVEELERDLEEAGRLLKLANPDNRHWVEKRDAMLENIGIPNEP